MDTGMKEREKQQAKGKIDLESVQFYCSKFTLKVWNIGLSWFQ